MPSTAPPAETTVCSVCCRAWSCCFSLACSARRLRSWSWAIFTPYFLRSASTCSSAPLARRLRQADAEVPLGLARLRHRARACRCGTARTCGCGRGTPPGPCARRRSSWPSPPRPAAAAKRAPGDGLGSPDRPCPAPPPRRRTSPAPSSVSGASSDTSSACSIPALGVLIVHGRRGEEARLVDDPLRLRAHGQEALGDVRRQHGRAPSSRPEWPAPEAGPPTRRSRAARVGRSRRRPERPA